MQMQHEITITLYNPTMKEDTWTADVYLKSFVSKDQNSHRTAKDERLYCGLGTVVENRRTRGQTQAEALHEAYEFLAVFSIPE